MCGLLGGVGGPPPPPPSEQEGKKTKKHEGLGGGFSLPSLPRPVFLPTFLVWYAVLSLFFLYTLSSEDCLLTLKGTVSRDQ